MLNPSRTEIRAAAPGRVNLIGEHTDYHDGFVMPCVIPQHTQVSVRLRVDELVRLSSTAFPGTVEYQIGREHRIGSWADYVQGLTRILQQDGHPLSGFDLLVRSDVPVGSGLASSAALQVATLRALRAAFGLKLPDLEVARIGQRAEAEFVGAPVGIMDQMASSLGQEGHALFLDTRSLECEHIVMPSSFELAVIDSHVAHQHAGGDYITRRRESEAAAQLLGVNRLRDAPAAGLARLASMPALFARRARHVITENARVLRAREALRRGDLRQFGECLNASHASLRDDYDVSIEAVDVLVDLAQRHPDVYGARMTGGGFGGAIVIACAAGSGRSVADTVVAEYSRRTGLDASVLLPARAEKASGA